MDKYHLHRIIKYGDSLQVATLGSYAKDFHTWLELSDNAKPHLKEGFKNISLQPEFIEASWQDILLHLVPGWDEIGTRLKRLDWAKNEVSDGEDMKEVPGWDQNGTKLLKKKSMYLIQILALTSKAISLDEMMAAIGYKNRATFRKNYLDVLENVEFVTKTIPETPSSPDQKYKLTDKGKLFLAGYKLDFS